MSSSNLGIADWFRARFNPDNTQLLQERAALQNECNTLRADLDQRDRTIHQLNQTILKQKNHIDYTERRIEGISWTLPVQTPFDPHHHLSFLSHSGIILGLLVAAVAIPLFALGMSGRKVLPLGKFSLACSTSNSLFFLLSGLGITGSMIGLKNNMDAARKQKHLNHYEKDLRKKEVAFQTEPHFKDIYTACKPLQREIETHQQLLDSLQALGLSTLENELENGKIATVDAKTLANAPKDITNRLQLVPWMREQRHLLSSTPGKLARFWLAIHKPVLHMVSIGALVGGIALVAFGSLLIAAHWKGKTSLKFIKWTVMVQQQDAIGYCIKGVSLILTAAGLELYVRGNDEAYLRKDKAVCHLRDTLQLALNYYRGHLDQELKYLTNSLGCDEDFSDDSEELDSTTHQRQQAILDEIQKERVVWENKNNLLYNRLDKSPLPYSLNDDL